MIKKSEKLHYYSLRSYLSYVKQFRLSVTVVICSFIIADLFLAIIPIFIGRLVGALSSSPIHGHQAIVDVWILVGSSFLHDLTWRLSEFLFMEYVKPLGYSYESILFRRIIHMPYPYFVDKFTGKISSYITTISQEVSEFSESVCYNYSGSIVSLLAVTIILATINWRTGLIFVVSITAMFFIGRITIKNSARYEKRATDIQSSKNARIIDAIANFATIKSFHKEQLEAKAVTDEQAKTIVAAKRSFFWSIVFWLSMSVFIRDIIWPATIIFNVYLFLHHELSIAQLTTLLSTVLLFSGSVWELIWYVSQFNLKLARLEEAHSYLFGSLNVGRASTKSEPVATRLSLDHGLALKNVSFSYPDKADSPVLKTISVDIRKGEKIGIVGQSGSGKSTLTKLLLGYYPISEGELLLDEHYIGTTDLADFISFVPQDTSLFHRTIAENIAYAVDQPVTRSQIVVAAKQAHADEFIAQITDGYDTLVGERGVKLSAGQRQRIAIARAFLDDKPILILDEATSALDSESELLVQEALEALWDEKTVIAIAHRLSTLRHMNRIIVLHQGMIVEQGSHSELLTLGGRYAKLWAHQSGGFVTE